MEGPSGDHSITNVSLAGSVQTDSSCHSQVSFGDIQVREFERIVGDHPDVSDRGPPLSIGWAYYQHDSIPLDDYECQHHSRSPRDSRALEMKRAGKASHPSRRRQSSSNVMEPLKGATRRIILQHGFNVSTGDILEMEKQVQETKRQRSQTARQSKLSERMEIAMQSAGRKLRRLRSS